VDDRVRPIECRVLEGGECRRRRQVDTGHVRLEAVEVGRAVPEREQQPLVAPLVGAFEIPKRRFDLLAVGLSRGPVAGVIQQQEDVMAR
jgi:hypothetical protein